MEIIIPESLKELYQTKSDIVFYPSPILRTVAESVTKFDKNLYKKVNRLVEIMRKYNGLGLSGNQIGLLERVICIRDGERAKILVNPEIIDESGEQIGEEGCLSIPKCYAQVHRSYEVTVKYQDVYGSGRVLTADGLEAVVLQHEISHTIGILFIDECIPETLEWSI